MARLVIVLGVQEISIRETKWKSEVETFARLDGFQFGGLSIFVYKKTCG